MNLPYAFQSGYEKTWFFDLDGTILKYNLIFTEGRDELLPGVRELWDTIPPEDVIVLTTARPEEFREQTLKFLDEQKIRYDHAIFNIGRGERILVNDNKVDGKITAFAWQLKRDQGFPQ